MKTVKAKLLSTLAAVAAILTVIGGLDLSGIINLLPANVATGFSVALPAIAALAHGVRAVGDHLDDGKRNDSWHYCHPFAVIGALLIALACVSCSAGTSWSIRTPYGDAESAGGQVIIVPKPVVIPGK